MENHYKKLIEAQNLTLMGRINAAFFKGEFVCPFIKDAEEDEHIIGFMSDYEKAVATVSQGLIDLHKKGETSDAEDYPNLIKWYGDFLWEMILIRFRNEYVSYSICLRNNWQITAKPRPRGVIYIRHLGPNGFHTVETIGL